MRSFEPKMTAVAVWWMTGVVDEWCCDSYEGPRLLQLISVSTVSAHFFLSFQSSKFW